MPKSSPDARSPFHVGAARVALAAALVIASASALPRIVCGRRAGAFFDGELEARRALALEVARFVRSGVSASSFSTGSARFDGEWALATHQMAALGLGQVVLDHPGLRADLLPVVEASVERLLSPEATAFGRAAWAGAPPPSGEAPAYLGYVNLALGMLRRLDPATRFASEHDALTRALAAALERAPHGLVETYPGETYPADVAAVVGSIALHARATGDDRRALLERSARALRRQVDPRSALLFQSVDASTGRPLGPARASGTAIAAYFLSFADLALSRELFEALSRSQRATFLGFGGVREYAEGQAGRGDIDSGPVLLGVSVSATGFALAGARIHGDRAFFDELFRTAELFGVSSSRGEGTRFLSGGPLGNAILLAMLTARQQP